MNDVSVLTPSYGYARFIEDAIQSVRAQSGVVVQHVVQDGGSTDGTVDVLKRYDQVLDWVSEPDSGQSQALNSALSRSSGRWIAWLNADEFYLPGALATLALAGDRSDADVVYGDAVFCDVRGRQLRLVPKHVPSHFVLRHYGMYVATCATLFRRDVLQEGSFDENLKMMMDKDLLLRLINEGRRFLYVPRRIGVFRVHDERVTAAPTAEFRDEYEQLLRRYGATSSGAKQVLARAAHAGLKLVSGGYFRQLRARRERGRDLRWFDQGGHPGVETTER